jgi:hypothetical protein
MAFFLHSSVAVALAAAISPTPDTQQFKIRIHVTNNPAGKNCLARKKCRLSRFLLWQVNVSPVGCLVPRRRLRRLSQSI